MRVDEKYAINFSLTSLISRRQVFFIKMLRYEGEAEWERRKAYLIRSMIAFPSALSPIREEPAETPSTADVIAQVEAERPLPDLIIERVYKRHHDDESDEYYDKFSKKIMRYYKKHILKEEVDDDASSFNESLVGFDTDDVNYEEDISFMELKNRRQEIYSIENQSLSFDDLQPVNNNTREFGVKNNDFSNRNQHSAERDNVENQLGTNKDGDSRVSPPLEYRCDGFSEATSSGTDINSNSRGDVIDRDATEILERLQYSKSSDDESSTKVDDKDKNSELSYNSDESCIIPVNLQSLTGYKTKSRSVQYLPAPKSPLIQIRIPDISYHLDESTSDESERLIASSTPREESNLLETIAEVHMVLDQDASKYPDHEHDIQHNSTERREAEKNHTFHEDTNDVEEDHNSRYGNHGHPDPEIEVIRSVHPSSQRLSIERQSSSPIADLSVPDFNTAIHLSFESIRNSNNGIDARETSVINDNYPRISVTERISINENEKSRVGLKRAFSYPDKSMKILKSVNTQTNEIVKQHKPAFVQTDRMAFLVNVVTQTEEMPKTNIDTQTQVDRQVKTVQIQTEEAVTNNVEIQTNEIREANLIDSESQTDDFLEGCWHRYCNYYETTTKFYFF